MGGRSCFITSGAFGDTLVSSVQYLGESIVIYVECLEVVKGPEGQGGEGCQLVVGDRQGEQLSLQAPG